MKRTIGLSLLFLPGLTYAQGLQEYIPSIIFFFSDTVLVFFIGIAFLFMAINVVRYFVFQSTNEEGRKTARVYLLYSILAFVLILVFWGLINLLVLFTGLQDEPPPMTDYEEIFG